MVSRLIGSVLGCQISLIAYFFFFTYFCTIDTFLLLFLLVKCGITLKALGKKPVEIQLFYDLLPINVIFFFTNKI